MSYNPLLVESFFLGRVHFSDSFLQFFGLLLGFLSAYRLSTRFRLPDFDFGPVSFQINTASGNDVLTVNDVTTSQFSAGSSVYSVYMITQTDYQDQVKLPLEDEPGTSGNAVIFAGNEPCIFQ